MSKLVKLLSMLTVFALLLAACSAPPAADNTGDDGGAEPTEAADDGGEPTEDVEDEPTEPADDGGDAVTIRWFVGLGTGGNPEQLEVQNRVVEEFNASQDEINLVLEVVENEQAYNVLATQIAAGEAPDIIGPVGILGLYTFQNNLLDITPLLESSGYDLSHLDPAMVDYYKIGPEGGQAGLPFAIFPSALWYNKTLFDEADLPYPPEEYGAPYVNADGEEVTWDIDAMEELAKELTVDANGNTPNDADFDPDNIVQFGFDMQWTPGRGQAALFGGGELVQEDGTAKIPEHWREFWRWYYEAIWEDHFVPNASYAASDTLAQGNTFSSGHIGMMPQNLWYTCCQADQAWAVAAIPEYQGTATAKLHADTFAILNSTEHPEEAFEVLTYLLSPEVAVDLLTTYGGFPADTRLQVDFVASLQERFPEVNFDVFLAGLEHVDVPNHEAGLPNLNAADERLTEFQTLYTSTPGLDIDAELDKLEADLTRIFQAEED